MKHPTPVQDILDRSPKEFRADDEVISTCGSMAGVNLSIDGRNALVSWSRRGKSTEPPQGLVHTEHKNL